MVCPVQGNQSMHLSAYTDALHRSGIKADQQLWNAAQDCCPPVGGLLLTPARVGKGEGIFFRDRISDLSGLVCQQQFAG